MPLELDHLKTSCNTLAELLEASNDRDQMEQLSEVVEKGFRAGIVHFFGVTLDLAEEMIRKQLSEIVTNPKKLSFACVICEAAKAGLIQDPDALPRHKFLRNKTTHSYNCELTEEAITAMPVFLDNMRFLIKELKRRNS